MKCWGYYIWEQSEPNDYEIIQVLPNSFASELSLEMDRLDYEAFPSGTYVVKLIAVKDSNDCEKIPGRITILAYDAADYWIAISKADVPLKLLDLLA